jgi:cell division protein FtsA
MKDTIITGLDIGSSKIRVVVAQKFDSRGLNIIGFAETSSEGISKGVIKSVEDAVSCISRTFEQAERMTGIPIERAFVSISGSDVRSESTKGVIAVAKADGEIKAEDVERVVEAAQAVSVPPNYEILHVIPREFSVDSQKGIKDPVGMTGIRLEADVQIVEGLSAQVKNITKVVYRAGVEVEDLVLASLAAAEAVLSKRQKELGVMVLNIGGATSSFAVFDEGDLVHSHVVPVGSSHISGDIAIGLRTSIDTAEEVKVRYGTADVHNLTSKEDIDLSRITEGEVGVVSRKHVAEIIEARVEEIFKLADLELEKISRSGKLPAGVVLCGGGAKLEGLIALARKIFRLPASVGHPRDIDSTIDKINDPSLATAVGLVKWGDNLRNLYVASGRWTMGEEVSKKMKKWFRSFFP